MKRVAKISDRIKQYREQMDWTLADMEKKTGCPAQTLNRYELGQRIPKIDTAIELAERLFVNPLWLQGYDVPCDFSVNDTQRLSSEENSHIKKYRALDEYGKGTVDTILDREYDRCQKQAQTAQKPATHFFRMVASDGTFEERYLTDEESAALEEEHRTAERATGI